MSYSNNYRANVQYSGSVSYSYPASQNGGSGTAHYSGTIPVNVTVDVNTDPFDGSVNRFNTSIDVLGGSVAAMNAAQCAAILKTAQDVSASLINGFFGTINTELSQQLQALDSAIKAGFALIQEQGKAVTDKKNVMEEDYNRISSRYVKLFADLDNECYKRIYALDKQSFNLAEKVRQELLSESSSNATAMNLLCINEVSSSKALIFVSSLNKKTLDVLKAIHDYISQESKINSLIESFLVNDEVDENISLFVPVIWSERDMLESNSASQECFIPEYFDQQRKAEMSEKVNTFCSGVSQSAWKAVEEPEKESLNKELNMLAELRFAKTDNETDQRVYKTMLSLWQNTELLSLKRSL